MATEEEKKRNLARMNAMIIYGLERALWELLGESAMAMTATVGEGMLEVMEKTMGLEIAGEDPQDILTEIGRIFVDEIGVALKCDITKEDDKVSMVVQDCMLLPAKADLIASGIPPFMCPYLNIAAFAMRKRLGAKTHIKQFEVDIEGKKCTLCFEMV